MSDEVAGVVATPGAVADPAPMAAQGGPPGPISMADLARGAVVGPTDGTVPADAGTPVEPVVAEPEWIEIPDARDPTRIYSRIEKSKLPEVLQAKDAHIAELHQQFRDLQSQIFDRQNALQQTPEVPVANPAQAAIAQIAESLVPELIAQFPDADIEQIRQQAFLNARVEYGATERAYQRLRAENEQSQKFNQVRSYVEAYPVLKSPEAMALAQRFGINDPALHVELCYRYGLIQEPQTAQTTMQPAPQPQAPPMVEQRLQQQRTQTPPTFNGPGSVTPAIPVAVQAGMQNWLNGPGKHATPEVRQSMLNRMVADHQAKRF